MPLIRFYTRWATRAPLSVDSRSLLVPRTPNGRVTAPAPFIPPVRYPKTQKLLRGHHGVPARKPSRFLRHRSSAARKAFRSSAENQTKITLVKLHVSG